MKMLTRNGKLMKNLLAGATLATVLAAVSPAFAGPAYEAEQDYEGWRAAEKAMQQQQAETQHRVIHRSNEARQER
jgi:hypothetical protein